MTIETTLENRRTPVEQISVGNKIEGGITCFITGISVAYGLGPEMLGDATSVMYLIYAGLGVGALKLIESTGADMGLPYNRNQEGFILNYLRKE